MQTINDLFEQKLRKRIAERIAELREQATAKIVSDLGSANYTVGKIAGLSEVFGFCDEVQTEINAR